MFLKKTILGKNGLTPKKTPLLRASFQKKAFSIGFGQKKTNLKFHNISPIPSLQRKFLHNFKVSGASASHKLSSHLFGKKLHYSSSKILSTNTTIPSAVPPIQQPPDKARVVIIGGGIIGTSIAYHLGKEKDFASETILLERDKLTSGTTWHAAGLIETIGSLSETATNIRQYTRDLYRDLEQETGVSTGWKEVGFIEMAANRDYLQQFRRISAFNRRHGVEIHEISPAEIKKLFPLAKVDDILAGFYVPHDGRANPVDATMSMASGARKSGVRLYENITVSDIITKNGVVQGVALQNGNVIQCEKVINCTGMWARQFGEKQGVIIPNQAAEHYYLITDDIPEVEPHWPVIEDPSSYTYIRPEGGGLMVGLFEPHAAAWNVQKIPEDSSFTVLPPDWERMTPFVEKAMERVPRTLEVGVKNFFCGPKSFTPDLSPILGETPEIRNYYVAAGMNSIGILSGGGIGRLMAKWVVNGYPDMDITGVNVDRFQKYQLSPQYRADRVVESLGMVYKCHYPSHALKTARGAKRLPLHHQWKEEGAYFIETSGWEAPGWFAKGKGSINRVDEASRTGWNERENWFGEWEAEHKAVRENVGLVDMSFMAKFLVTGPDAGRILNYMSVAEVCTPNTITYTQWLNDQGTLEGDVTVIRKNPNEYLVIATDTAQRHVQTLLQREIEDQKANAFVTDVTGAYAQLSLSGPKSRELLSSVISIDISDHHFQFRSAREAFIGYAPVTVARLSYVGELGFELFIPNEFVGHVFDTLQKQNEKMNLGLRPIGLKALGSLRLEKAYRDYGHDMDNTDGIREVGLSWNCNFKKPNGFKGMQHVLAAKKMPLKRKLVSVLVKDSQPFLYHGEPILRNGIVIGDIRSSSYGHTLGGAVGLTMIDGEEYFLSKKKKMPDNFSITKFLNEGKWEVEVENVRYPIQVSSKPIYDPDNLKIKC